jgi:hypothetical protein
MSEWRSVDKVAFIINVCICRFLRKVVILVKNVTKVSIDFTRLLTGASSLLEVPGLKLGRKTCCSIPFRSAVDSEECCCNGLK